MLQGHGSSKPIGFFIADSAKGKDLESNYALTGYQETVLNNFCKEQGMHLGDFYRTALIKQEEVKEKDDKKEYDLKNKNLIGIYAPILLEEINTLQPPLLIPLDEYSFNHLTGLNGITKFRGSALPPRQDLGVNYPVKILPTLAPDPYLYQDYKMKHIVRIDFSKIRKHANDSPLPDNLYNIWIARTSTALREFLNRAYPIALESGNPLVFDIETYMQVPICISFCFDGFESVCVPLVDYTIDFDHRALMLQLVAKLLASPIPKVNQNIKYDWKIMERWGFKVNNVVGDTMLAASTLYCEFPKNLGFLTSIYTDIPYFKDEGRQFDPTKHKREQYYFYNAKDSLATHQITMKQREEVEELGTKSVYENLVKLIPIYKRMEDRGLRRDELQCSLLKAKYESLFHIEELKLKRLSGRDYINALSNKQARDLIFNELGYKKIRGMKSTKSGEPSTDEESLQLLLVYGEAAAAPSTGPMVLECIINCRKIHKVLEMLELDTWPDGRFRCEFNLAGTETGRSSAGETTDQLMYYYNPEKFLCKAKNLGHSLQTIGKHGFMMNGETYGQDLRSMFVPSHGYEFVEIDLSGAEARVDRVLSGCFDMEVFDNPGIHRLTGSWIYDCQPHEIKKHVLVDGVDRYHMSKTVRHAGERNMGPERMVMMTQRPLSECKRILDKFHQYQPEIRRVFHKEINQAVDAPSHCLVAPNGRRRDFYDRIDKHTYNEAISYLPQAIVSDQTKFSFIPTTAEAPWAWLLAEMHDGSLWEVPKGRGEEFAAIYKRNIETPIDFRKCTLQRDYELIIPAEASYGEQWSVMED